MHVRAARAVCFKEALAPSFKEYGAQVVKNCKRLAEELIKRDFNIVSGGTDNHVFLVDLHNKEVTGKETENLLDRVGITLNKNTVPNETRSPFVTSGVRIGTAAVTTRGFKEEDMVVIAEIIDEAIKNRENEEALEGLKKKVKALCDKYPLYE